MNASLLFCPLAAGAFLFAACSTPEQRGDHLAQELHDEARVAKEDRRSDSDTADQEAQQEETRWQKFLGDYAFREGKAKNALTPAETAEARQMYSNDEYYRRRY